MRSGTPRHPSDKQAPRQNAGGFTLIELLVVIAIIGLLSTLALISYSRARLAAKEAKAAADVDTLVAAIGLLSVDTDKWPNGCPVDSTANPEIDLNDAQAGITQAPHVGDQGDGCFWSAEDIAKWRGPYAQTTVDPWGHHYWFDPDYYPRQNCPGYGATSVRAAVLSFGANGTGLNAYDCDDVYKILR